MVSKARHGRLDILFQNSVVCFQKKETIFVHVSVQLKVQTRDSRKAIMELMELESIITLQTLSGSICHQEKMSFLKKKLQFVCANKCLNLLKNEKTRPLEKVFHM